MIQKGIPEKLKEHILPFNWDVRAVWALDAMKLRRCRKKFDYLLDLPLWSSVPQKGMLFDLAPIEVIRNPEMWPYQNQRLSAADTFYPIDFLVLNGKNWILDGVHRLAKNFISKVEFVEVRYHEESIIHKIQKGQSDKDGFFTRPPQVSSPKGLPLQALSKPDVNLSTHPAPIVQPFIDKTRQ